MEIGVSNNAAGNGWREEMICSMKAQALASGEVAGPMNIIHHTVNAADQLTDLRSLVPPASTPSWSIPLTRSP